MARVHAPLFSLNQGEVSKLALARVDVAKLRLAAAAQVNWMPWTLGAMTLRPGLLLVGEVLNDLPAKLMRFVFSKLDTALIELTPNIMWVRVAEELIYREAVATQVSDGTFLAGTGWSNTGTTAGAIATANTGAGILSAVPVGGLARLQQTVSVAAGDQAIQHALRIVIDNGPVTFRCGTTVGASDLIEQTTLETGTHSLAFTPNAASFTFQFESTDAWRKKVTSVLVESEGAMTLPTPWAAEDLANIRYDQSGDVLFVACYGKAQQRIERRGPKSWSVVLYRSPDGPFKALPSSGANLSCNAFTGNGTLTSDRPFFQTGQLGCLFRMFISGQAYKTRLGAENAFTPPVRVSGVGATARNFAFTVAGSYGGTLTWQRSFDGPNSGFVDVANGANGQTGTVFNSATGDTNANPNLDNIVCWERVGFKAGNYASGVAEVTSNYYGDGAYGIVRVTNYVSPTQVDVEILQALSNTTATNYWVEQDWSDHAGYPSSVTFFDGRLFWFGRDQFWGSVSNNYTSYANQDPQGNSLGDAGALNEQFGAGPVDTVCWGLGLMRLLAGREGSVASIRASAFDEVLTPTNISSKDCTTHGAARLPAIKVDTSGVMVDQGGRRIYKLIYSPQKLDYLPTDLTRLNLDIGKPGFVSLDSSRQPDTNHYFVRTDGHCAVLLDEEDEDIACWWRIQTAGVIEDVVVMPDAGIEDLIYFVVRRTIGGVTRRFIERMAHRDSCVGGLLNVQADCCFSYYGDPISTLQVPWLPSSKVVVWADGLDLGVVTTDASGNCPMPDGKAHQYIVVGLGGDVITGSTAAKLPNGDAPDQVFSGLSNTLTVPASYEGCPCEVFADIGGTGRPVHIGALTVSGGKIALPNGRTATTITACLGYVAPFMSAKLAYAAQMGSALTQKKKIDHVGLIMFDTHNRGLQLGQRFDQLDDLPLVEADASTGASTVWPEYDEPMAEAPGEWNTDARLCLLAQAPRPATIGGVVVGMETHEKA